jgi:hypothetical protein
MTFGRNVSQCRTQVLVNAQTGHVGFSSFRLRVYQDFTLTARRAGHVSTANAKFLYCGLMTISYKTRSFAIAFTVLFIFLTANRVCWSQAGSDVENRPKSLILVPSAFDIQYTIFEGRPQLIYRLNADYPAEATLNTISAKLRGTGWKPLKSDFWNPSIRSSHIRGWQQFDDATTHPTTTVHSWMAQWENPQHDIVAYSLEYRYPVDAEPDLHALRVLAIFIPAAIANKMPKAVSQ